MRFFHYFSYDRLAWWLGLNVFVDWAGAWGLGIRLDIGPWSLEVGMRGSK